MKNLDSVLNQFISGLASEGIAAPVEIVLTKEAMADLRKARQLPGEPVSTNSTFTYVWNRNNVRITEEVGNGN